MNTDALRKLLIRHEGLVLKSYLDSKGKLTLGVGRNIEDIGISEEEALFMLESDIVRCSGLAFKSFPWFILLDEVRQIVIVSMIFNLGFSKFLEFKNFIKFMADRNYGKAANEMMSSLWASQVGKRAVELSAIMKTGLFIK